MLTVRHRGRYRMRNGEIAHVIGKDPDPNPYPWYGEIAGRDEADGWNSHGQSWHHASLDLVEHIPTT